MKSLTISVCVDRAFYTKHLPDAGFGEARAILIGGFQENELKQELRKELKDHLDRCECCNRFLKGLANVSELIAEKGTVIRAVCPSSESLDAYLYDRSRLPSAEARRVDLHLVDCEFCREELEWLRKLEEGSREPSARTFRKWPEFLAMAAALAFFILSAGLLWENHREAAPDEALRALAVIKTPEQIDYSSLKKASIPLEGELSTSYDQAVTLILEHKYEAAVKLLEKVTRIHPNHSAATYLLGYCYYQTNHTEKAFELCDRAEGMYPHAMERCVGLVHIALKTGHFGRAVREISALYHTAPDVPEIRTLYEQITRLTDGRSVQL